MFSPLISTLRNADVKNAVRKAWGRDKHSAGKSGCPALCRIWFIHTVVNVDKCDRYGRSVCWHSKLRPWRVKPPQPLSLRPLTETAHKGSGSDALWVLSSPDIREHSVLCIPWHDKCISALFFRESCEDCRIGFSDLFQETDNLEWDISHRAFLKHFHFFFFEVSTAIISKKQCQRFYKCFIIFFYINKSCI